MKLLWALYALFILYATTLPFRFELDLAAVVEKLGRVPLSVFVAPHGGRPSIPDMVQNVFLFVPFGVLGALALIRLSGGPAPGRGVQKRSPGVGGVVAIVTLLAAALSVIVEALQLFVIARTTSLNDVATNTLGGALGASAAAVSAHLYVSQLKEVRESAHQSSMDSSRYPVMVAAGLLAIASWHPFDASLDIGGIASKVRTFVADPWQAGTIGDEALDLLRYAFLGGAAARWFEGARVGRARMVAALVAASAAVAFELSQTIIGSRMPGLEDMLVGIAGGLVGASIGPRARQAPRLVAALVIALSVLATAGLLLTPFELASAWRPFGLMPFLGYYQYTSGQTVSHVVELMLAFLPIGYAWTSVSVQPGYRFLIAVVLMAGTLEYLQGWIVGRYPDVTDVMMMTLGALAGAWMGRGRLR